MYKKNSRASPTRTLLTSPLLSPLRRRRLPPRLLSIRNSSSSRTAPLEKHVQTKRGGGARIRIRIRIRIRLNHQVAFGESVTLLGSMKELGLWKKIVPMEWTENGWICEIKIRRGETREFKFVVVSGGDLVWEDGGNRVLQVPDGRGVFNLVWHWDRDL